MAKYSGLPKLSTYRLSTSYRAHLILSSLIGLWLVLFLIFIGPFDIAGLPLKVRVELMPPYGVIFIACYFLVIPFQNWLFKKLGYWNLFLELIIIGLVYLINIGANFQYYQSAWVKGTFTFLQFINWIFFPTLVVLTSILLFGRWFIATGKNAKITPPKEKLLLKGANKTDVLQLALSSLVCVSSAQNYVEVFYTHQDKLGKQLLRTTLKQIREEVPDLVQVHRSHLINPAHFVAWSGANTIKVFNLDIPVSQKYRNELEKYL